MTKTSTMMHYGGRDFHVGGSHNNYRVEVLCKCESHPEGHWDLIFRARTIAEAEYFIRTQTETTSISINSER